MPPAEHGALCIFEFFYLARPDTRLDEVEVHGARVRMGERLAAEAPVEADLVLPIPDSGTPAAIGFARATGIPFSEGLIKNRYVGRTFIQPDQGLRELGVKLKFNPLAEVAGKRVVVVDDSIVRGNTTRKIVEMLRDAGAAEVHVRISSPPVIDQCYYGIDLADPDELIARSHSVDEVRERDRRRLARLPLARGARAGDDAPPDSLCRACLTGDYPTASRPTACSRSCASRPRSAPLLLEHAARLRDPAAEQVGGGDPLRRVDASRSRRRLSAAAQTIANTISTRSHSSHSALPGIGSRAGSLVGRLLRRRGAVIGVLLSGGPVGHVDDLELEPVGVVEEHGVVAGRVAVLLRLALELGADRAQPLGALVDVGARERLEAEVVEADE